MTTFTDDQARQDIQALLDAAGRQGEARIRAKDGREYAVRPVARSGSPFEIPGVDLQLSREEIVSFVREGRERQQPRKPPTPSPPKPPPPSPPPNQISYQ